MVTANKKARGKNLGGGLLGKVDRGGKAKPDSQKKDVNMELHKSKESEKESRGEIPAKRRT